MPFVARVKHADDNTAKATAAHSNRSAITRVTSPRLSRRPFRGVNRRGLRGLGFVGGGEQLTGAILFAIALAIRVPYLWTIPSLTDEVYEVLRGLDVAQGRLWPLTNVNAYLGSGYNWLLGSLFALIGPNVWLARGVVAVCGALTAPATYLLARSIGTSRIVAALAAGALATSGAHILVSSHVAWSHSLTPLATTAALAALAYATRHPRSPIAAEDRLRGDRRGPVLALAGLLFGVMVQTHSSTLAILPGVAMFALLARPLWVRTRWPYLAALTLLLPNSNLIAYNLLSGGGSIGEAQAVSVSYTRSGLGGFELYVANLGRLGLALARCVAGAVDIRAAASDYLSDPTLWLAVALCLLGTTRLRCFALWIAIPYALALPLANAKFEVVPNGRFLAPLLPLAYVALASGLERALAYVRPAAVPIAGAALVLWPVIPLSTRYAQMSESAATSAAVIAAVETVRQLRQPDEWVALDPDLDKLWLDGGGDFRAAFRYYLSLQAVPNAIFEFRRRGEQGDINSCAPNQVELRRVEPAVTPAAPRLILDDPNIQPDDSANPYWLIRTVQRSDRARDAQRGESGELSRQLAVYSPPLTASSRAVDRCAPGRPI